MWTGKAIVAVVLAAVMGVGAWRLRDSSTAPETYVAPAAPMRAEATVAVGRTEAVPLTATGATAAPPLDGQAFLAPRATYPAAGKVTFHGAPANGAFLVLHPLPGSNVPPIVRPNAHVKADGTYVLSTFTNGDGAPPGEYAVTVEWLTPTAEAYAVQKNRLPRRYAKSETSGLRILITKGANALPDIELAD